MKINVKKLQKALDRLERKSNYVNMEYYYPKYEKLLGFINKNQINKIKA